MSYTEEVLDMLGNYYYGAITPKQVTEKKKN